MMVLGSGLLAIAPCRAYHKGIKLRGSGEFRTKLNVVIEADRTLRFPPQTNQSYSLRDHAEGDLKTAGVVYMKYIGTLAYTSQVYVQYIPAFLLNAQRL